MSENPFEEDFTPEETEVVETAEVGPSTFESLQTVKKSVGHYDPNAESVPLYTHEAPVLPDTNLVIDLTGNSTMLSIDEILAGRE